MISLQSCLAFRKYLNLNVLFGVKNRTGRVIPRTGLVIFLTGHLLSMTFSKYYLQSEQSQDQSFLIIGIKKVRKSLICF